MFLKMLGFGFFLKKNKISMAGLSPVYSVLFKTVKPAMMLCWFALFVHATEIYGKTYDDYKMQTRRYL
jgi:hypothetical protein